MMKALKLAICFPGILCIMLMYLYRLHVREFRPMTWLAKKYPVDKIWIILFAFYRKHKRLICMFSPERPDVQIAIRATISDRIVGFHNIPCLCLMHSVLALPLKKRSMN